MTQAANETTWTKIQAPLLFIVAEHIEKYIANEKNALNKKRRDTSNKKCITG